MAQRAELVPGTLEMMVMKAVSERDLHGFGIARWLEAVTGDELSVEEGAMYPALHRMEKRGWVASDWQRTENGRRARYYRLTEAGRQALAEREARWRRSVSAVALVLDAEG